MNEKIFPGSCICLIGMIVFCGSAAMLPGKGEAVGQYVNLNNYLIVYTQENYQGTAYRLPYETPDTHLWNFYNEKMQKYEDLCRGQRRSDFIYVNIKSIRLHSFTHVTLFEGENYGGYCTQITRDIPALKDTVMLMVKSLSVGRACPERLALRRFNVFVDNTLFSKIRYRLKVNGGWENTWSEVARRSKISCGLDSREVVFIQVQFRDLAWKDLAEKKLVWNRNNYLTVRKEGRFLYCDLKH